MNGNSREQLIKKMYTASSPEKVKATTNKFQKAQSSLKPLGSDAANPISNKNRLLKSNCTVARTVDFSKRIADSQAAQSKHFLSGSYGMALANILSPPK